MRRVCLGHEPEQVAVVGTKCQGLVEDGECLRSPLKLQKAPRRAFGPAVAERDVNLRKRPLKKLRAASS